MPPKEKIVDWLFEHAIQENYPGAAVLVAQDGKVTGAVHHQAGRTLNAPKLQDEPVAKVDPALYDVCVGEYKLENVGVLKVTRESTHLYVQAEGQPPAEIFPRTQTDFFLKIVQADITFTKDKDGRVTGLTFKQSGMTLTGPKIQ
jgi:hypothetical protein